MSLFFWRNMDYQLSVNENHNAFCYAQIQKGNTRLKICCVNGCVENWKEVSLDEPPLSLVWSDENIICLGRGCCLLVNKDNLHMD